MNVNITIACLISLLISVTCKIKNDKKWKCQENNGCFSSFEEVKTWYEANKYCNGIAGTLASISNDKENVYIKSEIVYGGRYWLGLNSLNLEGEYIWLDRTPVKFTKWKEGWTDIDENEKEKCVYFDAETDTWNDAHCEEKMKFICKKIDGEIPPFPISVSGNCPSDWYQLDSFCYKFFDIPKSWENAKRECRLLGNKNNHDLVSIHNFKVQSLLTSYLQEDTWIGGTFFKNTNQKIWSDNSQFDYQYEFLCEDMENSCFQMKIDEYEPGKWDVTNCTEEKPYICQTYINSLIPNPPTDKPEKCENSDFQMKSYRDDCYYFHDEAMSWIEGERVCEKFGAHLASISDAYENSFINFYVGSSSDDVWFGLKGNQSQYKWLSNWPLNFTNWMNDQPVNINNKDGCGLIDRESYKWKVAKCQDKHSFICKLSDIDPPVLQEIKGYCPICVKNWKDLSGSLYCYEVFDKKLKWSSAVKECSKYDGKLLSFHSLNEVNSISQNLKNLENVWIGLFRLSKGSYRWQDGSSVDFVKWENKPTGEGECVEMVFPDQYWKNAECDTEKPFICGVKKILLNDNDNDDDKSDNKNTKSGMSPGHIAAICVTLIFVVLIIVNVILWKKGILQRLLRR